MSFIKYIVRRLTAAMTESSRDSWANARSVKSMVEHIYIQRAMCFCKEGILDREINSDDVCPIPYDHHRRIGF